MHILTIVLSSIVAIEHLYILILEMFLNKTEKAAKTFNIDRAFLQDERVQTLFKNQGLYNGFLAAGIVYGLFMQQLNIVTLFIVFVIIAAIYGGLTSSKGILIKQGLPALLAFIAILIFK